MVLIQNITVQEVMVLVQILPPLVDVQAVARCLIVRHVPRPEFVKLEEDVLITHAWRSATAR